MLVTWMSFASVARELRRGALTMLETHRDELSNFLPCSCSRALPSLLLMLCLISLMNLTITHMVSFHERNALCLDTLVTAHIIIMVIVSHVGPAFLLEGLLLTLSLDT
jgi:ABC-type dipeptide/oligopeptide/nickel transport system permease subunit